MSRKCTYGSGTDENKELLIACSEIQADLSKHVSKGHVAVINYLEMKLRVMKDFAPIDKFGWRFWCESCCSRLFQCTSADCFFKFVACLVWLLLGLAGILLLNQVCYNSKMKLQTFITFS